jgi:hypothetical protein
LDVAVAVQTPQHVERRRVQHQGILLISQGEVHLQAVIGMQG